MTGLASLLFSLAISVGPADRGGWFDAMGSEFEFIPPSQRLRFATGCLAAAMIWRIWTPQGVRKLTQAGLVAASASLAALATINALTGSFGHFGPMMAALGLAYAGGAAATGRWGLRGMAVFALAGIALNTSFVLAWTVGVVEPRLFLRALSIEAYFILGVFLGAAAAGQALATRLERSA